MGVGFESKDRILMRRCPIKAPARCDNIDRAVWGGLTERPWMVAIDMFCQAMTDQEKQLLHQFGNANLEGSQPWMRRLRSRTIRANAKASDVVLIADQGQLSETS